MVARPYVQRARGRESLQSVLDRLSSADRETLGTTVLPFRWYPFALNVALDRSIAEEFAIGSRVFLLLGDASEGSASFTIDDCLTGLGWHEYLCSWR